VHGGIPGAQEMVRGRDERAGRLAQVHRVQGVSMHAEPERAFVHAQDILQNALVGISTCNSDSLTRVKFFAGSVWLLFLRQACVVVAPLLPQAAYFSR